MSSLYREEGYRLMGAGFEVYNEVGYGMAEEVYQECLDFELSERRIPFVAKQALTMSYKQNKLQRKYQPDLFVFSAIAVELKALKALTSDHEAQLFNYMRIARQPVGYLINFGRKAELEWQRFILSDLHERTQR